MLWFNCAISLLLLATTLKQSASQQVGGGIEYGNGLLEGDIRLTPELQRTMESTSNPSDPNSPQNAVVRNERQLWPGGVVPYQLDGSLNSQARIAITNAVAEYASETCVRFIERTNQVDYVRIFPGSGCFSYIGRTTGPQDMSIGSGCEFQGIVVHEMFHALGRWHEQSRPDRDQFVRILPENIQSGTEGNFEITNPSFVTTQGIPYDTGSVMHYSSTAFSRNGQPTILPVDNTNPNSLGQRNGLSTLDIQHVNTLYCGGSGVSGGSWSSWSAWSSCTRTCNGGTRSRTRTCVGGTDCDGSNIDTQQCNSDSCPVVATWGSWSTWGGCTNTCGGGRQMRTRSCENGNTCLGTRAEYRNCNTQACPIPASWASWGSWSSCSRTCQGGFRQRRRTCQNGNTCPGADVESDDCNTNIPCQTTEPNSGGEWTSWSTCSAQCGGGSRFRVRLCESDSSNCQTEKESCNTEDCDPEPEVLGLKYQGCWYLNSASVYLQSFERTTADLSDNPITRERPVSKCGTAILAEGYSYFGVTVGYCLSGSNYLGDYQYYRSSLCRDGRGSYTQNYGGWFLMDVYEITNQVSFSDSVIQLNSTATPDMTVATGSGYTLTYNLVLLVSAVLTAVLSMAVM